MTDSGITSISFSQENVDAVWLKASSLVTCRQDLLKCQIKRPEYGKETPYGWVIHHVVPVSLGGSNELDNLIPLWWKASKEIGEQSFAEVSLELGNIWAAQQSIIQAQSNLRNLRIKTA